MGTRGGALLVALLLGLLRSGVVIWDVCRALLWLRCLALLGLLPARCIAAISELYVIYPC